MKLYLWVVKVVQLSLVFSFFLSCLGCTFKSSGSASQSSQSNIRSRVLNLAVWSNYVTPELISQFKKKTGIEVLISNYSSNEELLGKLQAGASGYDIIVPSDYMVYAMIHLGLLLQLDYSKISNSKFLDPKFLRKPYDPENKFSVPYDWGTTGFAINRTLYSGKLKSWRDFFQKDELAGKISLLDDAREVIGAALKSQKFSLNSTSSSELAQAKELLLKAKSKVKIFTSEPMMSLVNGEIAVSHIYMSDALQARRATAGKIEYVIPEEGGTLWIDNLSIPIGAKNQIEAYEFMNYLLESHSNASTVLSVLVAPANRDVFSLLPRELQKDPALFPPSFVLARCEMIQDLGDFMQTWDRVWTEVKTSVK